MTKFLFGFSLTFIAITLAGQTAFRPDERYSALSSKAYSLYEQKHYLQSALSYDTLFKLYEGRGLRSDKYNAACSWALIGNDKKAFYYLEKAIVQDKWENLKHLLADSDLNSLHNDKRWQTLVNAATENKAKAEAKLNKPLVALLDTIFKVDQNDRMNIDTIRTQYGWQSKEIDSLWKKINYQDSINLIRVKQVIDRYGWLGVDEIGEQGNTTLFLVIQHADLLTQVTYLPIMRKAAAKGNLPTQNLALLEDRILIRKGEKQIYGSQLRTNKETGKYELYPIDDEPHVNQRRAAVGLEPLEKYAKNFGLDYTLPTNHK